MEIFRYATEKNWCKQQFAFSPWKINIYDLCFYWPRLKSKMLAHWSIHRRALGAKGYIIVQHSQFLTSLLNLFPFSVFKKDTEHLQKHLFATIQHSGVLNIESKSEKLMGKFQWIKLSFKRLLITSFNLADVKSSAFLNRSSFFISNVATSCSYSEDM